MHRAYLSLGSNLEPEHHLTLAVRELREFGCLLAVSRVWETEPFGNRDQPNFLNAAVLLDTALEADALYRDAIKPIEEKLNRVRDPRDRNAPRTIDIDLSLFDNVAITVGHRRIPDPDILTRSFVAVPLAELDPEYPHPETGETLREIANRFLEHPGTQLLLRTNFTLARSCNG